MSLSGFAIAEDKVWPDGKIRTFQDVRSKLNNSSPNPLTGLIDLANAGDSDAQAVVGAAYFIGDELPKDMALGLRYLRMAAAKGHADALYNLGVIYDEGNGVLQDKESAFKLYLSAAHKGHPQAQNNLSRFYVDEVVIKKNIVKAHMWLNLASAQGNDGSRTSRDAIAKYMTPQEIRTANQLAKKCLESRYKQCD